MSEAKVAIPFVASSPDPEVPAKPEKNSIATM